MAIGDRIDVGQGFVQLIDVLGDDLRVVEAARTSYGKVAAAGSGGRPLSYADEKLLRLLLRHRHTTPFEMPQLQFLIEMPMDVNRQHIRHRMSSTNEYSTRYKEAIDRIASTDEYDWRQQATTNKQGSAGVLEEWPDEWRDAIHDPVSLKTVAHIGGALPDLPAGWILGKANTTTGDFIALESADESVGHYLSSVEKRFHATAINVYQERLKLGVAREQARKDLPLSNYTRMMWSIDLHNFMHYLGLRMEKHAQKEIREYAWAMYELAKPMFPACFRAFADYRFDARSFSRQEMRVLRALVKETSDEELRNRLKDMGVFDQEREVDEFITKLREECIL